MISWLKDTLKPSVHKLLYLYKKCTFVEGYYYAAKAKSPRLRLNNVRDIRYKLFYTYTTLELTVIETNLLHL